jgi:hypothetical protein
VRDFFNVLGQRYKVGLLCSSESISGHNLLIGVIFAVGFLFNLSLEKAKDICENINL